MADQNLTVITTADGWELHLPSWGRHYVVLRRVDGCFEHHEEPQNEVMVTASALILRGEIVA